MASYHAAPYDAAICLRLLPLRFVIYYDVVFARALKMRERRIVTVVYGESMPCFSCCRMPGALLLLRCASFRASLRYVIVAAFNRQRGFLS